MRKITQKELRFAKRLKKLRKEAGLTQEELAEKCDLSTTYIGLLETGKRRPSMDTLNILARKLDVRVSELIPY